MDSSSTLGRIFRSFRRSPGFVAIATLSLGCALGLSTAVFALMDAMTHPEPPFRDVDLLVALDISMRVKVGPSKAEFRDAIAKVDGVGAVTTAAATADMVIAGERADRSVVSLTPPGYFDVLGLRPRLGRLPHLDEQRAEQVAVVSDRVWRRNFANRAAIGEATIVIGSKEYAVIGVLPNGTDPMLRSDYWIPDPLYEAAAIVETFVRLKPGYSIATFQPRIKELFDRYTKVYAQAGDRGIRARILPMRPDPLQIRDIHRAMLGSAVCVLIIACANVAALMLARGMIRTRDYALRLALGASRREISREVLAELAALAVIGCATGAIAATWVVGVITKSTPEEFRWSGFVQPQWSWRVLAASLVAVVGSIAVAGGYPAWRAARTDPVGPLKESSGGNTGRAGTRFRWLVMAELALSMTLLVGTSLMLKSVHLMASYDFGYDVNHLMMVNTVMMYRDTTGGRERRLFRDQAIAAVRSLPGVASVSITPPSGCPIDNAQIVTDRTVEGGPLLRAEANWNGTPCTNVGAHFFTTLGLTMVDGRDFDDGDNLTGAAVLDEATAARLLPHERAVGRTIKLGDIRSSKPWLPVVGVVRNHNLYFNMFPEAGDGPPGHVYASLPDAVVKPQERLSTFIFRSDGSAKNVQVGASRVVAAVMPARSFTQVERYTAGYDRQLVTERYLGLIFSMLGAASLLLGAAGLFSVVSYIAGQRMREFAVRIALGAQQRNVLRLVLREGFVMAIGGTAVGAGFGMWAGFLLWDKMWGVYPVDAGALVSAEAVLLLVTMLSCVVPAVRATRANPLEIIRAS